MLRGMNAEGRAMAMGERAGVAGRTSGFARVVAPMLEDERPPLRRAPHAALFGLLAVAWLGGAFEPSELALGDLRFAAAARPASGELILIEGGKERASPTRLAKLLDALVAADVRQVAFADQPPTSATEFRAALARAGERVVLPAGAEPGYARQAALDLPADSDGRTRSFPIWRERPDGEAIPTLPAALLGVGVAGAPAAPAIDFSIRPETLPRLSLSDALAGGANLRDLAGRDVLVALRERGEPMAATAQGPLPRAELLALAYETLAQQRWIVRSNAAEALAPAAALMLALGPWFVRWSWRRGLVALVAWQAACVALSLHAQAAWAISVDVLPWLAAPLLSYAWETTRRVRQAPRSPAPTSTPLRS
jgi:hypothetical protein